MLTNIQRYGEILWTQNQVFSFKLILIRNLFVCNNKCFKVFLDAYFSYIFISERCASL